MVARPLLQRLEAVRGEVDLTVLRPAAFDALTDAVRTAAEAGEPFHVVHFDMHGAMPGRPGGGTPGGRPGMMTGTGEGVLTFERPGGDSDPVGASKVAGVLVEGKVPVVVLNACQSGAVGKELEASVATALLKAGCAAVVAMAYSVYAVAAAEFMAAFYESLFTGTSVGQAATAGRKRLFAQDGRPSPKGDMPLADWLVPVHYMRAEVRFPDVRTGRPAAGPSLDEALDQIRAASPRQRRLPKIRWRRWARLLAGMTCFTNWRPRPGCSEWWCLPVQVGQGRQSWLRGSRGGGGTPAGSMTRGWHSGTRSSPALRPLA